MGSKKHIALIVDGFKEKELKKLCTEYAKKKKDFESFLLSHSNIENMSLKSIVQYREELQKLVKKAESKKGFFKTKRVQDIGIFNYGQDLKSFATKKNNRGVIQLGAPLIEALHTMVIMNTRYRSFKKPFKKIKILLAECKKLFDEEWKNNKLSREDKKILIECFLSVWWKQQQFPFAEKFWGKDDLFFYINRDEEYLQIIEWLNSKEKPAQEIDKKFQQYFKRSKNWWNFEESSELEVLENFSLSHLLSETVATAKERLDEWG